MNMLMGSVPCSELNHFLYSAVISPFWIMRRVTRSTSSLNLGSPLRSPML